MKAPPPSPSSVDVALYTGSLRRPRNNHQLEGPWARSYRLRHRGTLFVTPFGHLIECRISYERQDRYSHEHNATDSETTTKHRIRDPNVVEKYNTHAQMHKSTSDYTGVSHSK